MWHVRVRMFFLFYPNWEQSATQCNPKIWILTVALPVYKNPFQNVVVLVGHNVSTNNAVSRLIGSNIAGCHGQKSNLAVKDILMANNEIIICVKEVSENSLSNSCCKTKASHANDSKRSERNTLEFNISYA